MLKRVVNVPTSRRLIAVLVVAACALAVPALETRAYVNNDPFLVTFTQDPPGVVACNQTVQITAHVINATSGQPQSQTTAFWDFKTALSAGDAVSPAHSNTDNHGNASTTVHFGPVEGQRTVRATVAQWPHTTKVTCMGGLPSPTPSPTPTPTPTSISTPTPIPTPTPTAKPTPTPTPVSSASPTPIGSAQASPSGEPQPSSSELPSATPVSASPSASIQAVATTSAAPVSTPESSTSEPLPSPVPSASPAVTDLPATSSTGDLLVPALVIVVLVIVLGGTAAFAYTRRR